MAISADQLGFIIEASRAAETWPNQVNAICDARKHWDRCPETWDDLASIFAGLEASLRRWSGTIHEYAETFDGVSEGTIYTPVGFCSSGHSAAIRYAQSFYFSIYIKLYDHQLRQAIVDDHPLIDWGTALRIEEVAEKDPLKFIHIAGTTIDEWSASKVFDPSEVIARVRVERARLLKTGISLVNVAEETSVDCDVVPATESPPDFAVNVELCRVSIGHTHFAVSEEAAHYLQVLNSHRGEVMSDPEVAKTSGFLSATTANGSRARFGPVRDSISHVEIKKWIEKVPQKGFKLRPPSD